MQYDFVFLLFFTRSIIFNISSSKEEMFLKRAFFSPPYPYTSPYSGFTGFGKFGEFLTQSHFVHMRRHMRRNMRMRIKYFHFHFQEFRIKLCWIHYINSWSTLYYSIRRREKIRSVDLQRNFNIHFDFTFEKYCWISHEVMVMINHRSRLSMLFSLRQQLTQLCCDLNKVFY